MKPRLRMALVGALALVAAPAGALAACGDGDLVANGIHGTTAEDGMTPRWRFIISLLDAGDPKWGRCDLLFQPTGAVITADIGTRSRCADWTGKALTVRGGSLTTDEYCQIAGSIRLRRTVSPGTYEYLVLTMTIGQLSLDKNVISGGGHSDDTSADWTPTPGTKRPITFSGIRGIDRYTLP